MFGSLFLTCALIAITLTAIQCQECKESEHKCSTLDELDKTDNCFTAWVFSKCEDSESVMKQEDIELYKKCSQTHLEPCVSDKVVLKKLLIDIMHDEQFNLHELCSETLMRKIEEYWTGIQKNNTEQLAKEVSERCSVIRQAFENVKVCVKI